MSFTESVERIVEENRSGLLAAAASWTRVRLGDVCEVLNGFPFPSVAFNPERGVPLMRIRDVGTSATAVRFEGGYDDAYLVRPGELVVGMDGDFKSALWAGETSLLNQRVCKLTPDERFYSLRLLAHVLPAYLDAVNAKTSSITVKHLSSKTVAEIPLPLPPRAHQDRLVESIESHLTRLDAAVASLERVQRNLKRYRTSVLKAAVEGRLVPSEAELDRREGRSYEPASVLLNRILAQRRRRWGQNATKTGRANAAKAYTEPAEPSEENLPKLPAGWCWTTMEALTADGPQNGLYVPNSKYGSGVPILRIEDFQTNWCRSVVDLQRIAIDAATAATFGLREGDLVVNRVNSPSHLGKAMAVTNEHGGAVFESNMMRVRLAAEVRPRFVADYLNSSVGKARLTANAKWAVNQASINQKDVGATRVPLPPAAEQARVVEEVDRLVSTSMWIERVACEATEHCQRLRQSILKWAFEGRLVDQDPTDEPASTLLERIRAEREASSSDGGARPKRTKLGRGPRSPEAAGTKGRRA